MRTLQSIEMTPEQLAIFSRNQPGVELIRGAAGSGKTTTALLKLRSQIPAYINRRRRLDPNASIDVLVLTYNRTLRGYVAHLAQSQAIGAANVNLEIETFSSWAKRRLSIRTIHSDSGAKVRVLGNHLDLDPNFLNSEVEYLTGRFLTADLKKYLTTRRVGRGTTPRVERSLREQILTYVVEPYNDWKRTHAYVDWNDLAMELAAVQKDPLYDIVIADETQDFSANQIRAILNQLKIDHSVTFVLDSAQRIYPRGFAWSEVGLELRPERSKRLTSNYRNTRQIARVAASIVSGLLFDDDGTIPDPESCILNGPKPKIIVGKFSEQIAFVVRHIRETVNLNVESVVFLHPLGGKWFDAIRNALRTASLKYVELTREATWPAGQENIGLTTFHSAKGLEFDHVYILGLSSEVTSHGEEEEDDRLDTLRRLFAMGVGRAKHSVIIGYKQGEASKLVALVKPEDVQRIDL